MQGQRSRIALAPQAKGGRRAGFVAGQQGDAGGTARQAGVAVGRRGGLQVPLRRFIQLAGLQREFAGDGRLEQVVAGGGAGVRGRAEGWCRRQRQDEGQDSRKRHCGHPWRAGRKMAALSYPKLSARHMTLLAIGINHQTAPVELRERVALADHALPAALEGLRELPSVREVVLLSTCNRTELYAVTEDDGRALDAWMASHPADAGRHDMAAYLYRHQDADAVRHLFRVATGLDSLVLGEPQILGQVKQAWAAARSAGTLGGQLDRLFQQAFLAAKRARTDTRIGANPVSVASTAVHLAQSTFARLEDAVVLLVGAGETIELVARHLGKVKRLLVATRTLAHAQDLASRHGGVALPLDALQRHLAEADIVFCATASREPVIRRTQVEAALAQRRH